MNPEEAGAESALPLSGDLDNRATLVDPVWRLYGELLARPSVSPSITTAVDMIGTRKCQLINCFVELLMPTIVPIRGRYSAIVAVELSQEMQAISITRSVPVS